MQDIRRYYARVASAATADGVLRAIAAVARRLADRPLARRPREELAAGLRSAPARRYTVFFRVAGNDVEIVRVLHERRDFAAAFDRDRE